ncbi:MAG: M1 family metallopeptidase, partial [Thermoanaerobaculia bacterium]
DRVIDAGGRELSFARDNIGARSRAFDKRLHDPQLTVFLAEPAAAGQTLTLAVDYELEISNFVTGADWYPTYHPPDAGLTDLHTARIVVTAPDDVEVRAMGAKEGETREGKLNTTVFRLDRPAKMVTFTTARRLIEERHALESLPTVVVFGSDYGVSEDMLHDTGADIVNSMNYFQELFDSKLPGDELRAAMIDAGHGQAFDGMLHLPEYSGVEFSATVPFFRAHEVAHQWWGHMVGWKTYRDQWLSEGFAEYSAMLYMAASLDNGEKLFQEALQVSRDELTGSLKTAFSRFSRPGQTLLNSRAAARIGPIGHGYRANVGASPGAYFSLAYNKGAYVLHMLRTILRGVTGSDETFFTILRDFVATYQGKAASTEDFQQIVTRHAPADWSWFFDQWVYGAEIPTYEWDWKTGGKTADGKTEIVLRVRQRDVPAGFRMLVPVRVELPGGQSGEMPVMIDEPEKEVTIALPAPPKTVEFNPGHAVLAKVKRM